VQTAAAARVKRFIEFPSGGWPRIRRVRGSGNRGFITGPG
jgi:hypothetical protein